MATDPLGALTSSTLGVTDYLDALTAATELLAESAQSAGADAQVPTCPQWTVRDLVAHQGMVHRWALAAIQGAHADIDAAELEAEGRAAADQVSWLRRGSQQLAEALVEAPQDLEALVFLKDAPPPRTFWARRQCHETTIHAVDALAAALGRPPNAKQVPISDELALDGIDELLVGFWQRGRNSPHTQTHERTLVSAGRRGWLLHSSPEAMRTARFAIKDSDTAYEVDAVISGDPVDVYLAVWNRGGDVIDSARRLATWKSTILW